MSVCIERICSTPAVNPAAYRPPQQRVRNERTSGNTAQASFRSRESAVLEVTTADGDRVRLSFTALRQARAAANESSQSFSGRSRVDVRVSVDGSLDDEETSQIGDLLEKLVVAAQAGDTAKVDTGSYGSLDRYAFGYKAYQQVALLQ